MKSIKNERIGISMMMNCGMKATIIAYRQYSDIDIQFEDGTIVKHKRYDHFKTGAIKFPENINPHIGETIKHKDHTYTIKKWRSNHDIDFVRDDGILYEHKTYYHFKHSSSFKNNNYSLKNHIGERKKMNCSEFATIINCANGRVTIKFDDGTIRENIQYNNFKRGMVCKNPHNKKDRIGEKKLMSNGQSATIICYRKSDDIDIQFEDGYIKKSISYSSFKSGFVQNPNKLSKNAVKLSRRFDKSKYIGKVNLMNCGISCKIIDAIGTSSNLTVQFENGEIREGVSYSEFSNGCLLPKSGMAFCRLLEENIMNNGQTRIREPQLEKYDQDGVKQFYLETAELGSENLKILMKDILAYIQSICDVKLYIDFNKNATIKTPDSYQRTGKMNVMKNGMQCTIITYRNASNIDVQFEDGTIVKHKTFKCFQRGNIANPNISIKDKRIGMSLTMNCGMKATIIDYSNSQDIDVQFEDGTIVEHIAFARFKKGELKKSIKDKRIGMSLTMNCGMKATIIDYHNCSDINVQFEDGTVVKHRAFAQFKNKQIANPNILIIRPNPLKDKRKGMSLMMNCDMKATIIAYRNSQDIDIQFEDGIIVKHKAFDSFQKGKIANPNISIKDKRIGQSLMMSCGMKATIIAYRNCNDIDVQFEDGTIVKHKRIGNFRGGHIANPNIKINPNIISL